jgi:para-nitrobenzyl esterase
VNGRRTVETKNGPVSGRANDDGVWSFLGIPYASAPAGPLRFRPPVPPRPWTDALDARAYGPTAPQARAEGPVARLLPEVLIPGDDYLNLNVWTADPDGARPVMVFIHGGSFSGGSGAISTYNGSRFARHGVVLVTINYRLGADGFGWFGDGTPNLGLLDQVAALAWVRDNIAAFGGDPANVTIFGESAGAMSVCTLIAMPAATGLFRRAIAQSGAARCVIGLDTAERIGARLAEILGVAATRAAIAAVPMPRLLAAQSQLAQEVAAEPDPWRWGDVAPNIMPFEPVIDGHVLPCAPIEALRQASGVDILIGTNADEANLFFVPTGAVDQAGPEALSRFVRARRYPPSVIAAYRAARPMASDGELMSAIMTDGFYRIPALEVARAHRRTYVYEFAWPSPAFGGALGACHALELPFVFDNLDDPGYAPVLGARPPRELAESMHRAWAAFAAAGDPGWPPFDDRSRLVRRFGAPGGLIAFERADNQTLFLSRTDIPASP